MNNFNKKYKYLDNNYDTIGHEDDRNRELLNPNSHEDLSVSECLEEKFVAEQIHGQANYKNIQESIYANNKFAHVLKQSDKLKLISESTKIDDANIEESETVKIDLDNSKEECSEIRYDFDKYNIDKNGEHDELMESRQLLTGRRSALMSKIIIGIKIGVIIALVFLLIFLSTKFKRFLTFLQQVIEWVGKQGSWSVLLFIVLFTIAAPLFMSVEVMCIGSGLIFSGVYGKVWGLCVATFAVAVGYLLGMSICFFISRYLIHNYIYKKLMAYPLYMAFNQAINTDGLSFVLLIRLSPILPASMVSYMFGVTTLKYKDFALGSISALPSIFLFTYMGALLQDFSNISDLENHWGNIVVLIIGFLIGVAAIVYITIITKRRLRHLNIMNASLASTTMDVE